MNGQRGQLRKLVGRALVSLATTVVAAALLAPTVAASPIGDAEAAMMAAWDKAGGDTSPLGARKGDVYPVGDGFALDFDGGKMFYTTDTGAKYIYGPILDKYESLGGPASSDLGFPTINEVPGLAGPDSRAATFSASDKPVIFWTPDHGAFVVRGALNAAWDRLGSSGGVLGAPVGDETYDGEVTSQKFTGGAVSWNRKTKEFTTEPRGAGRSAERPAGRDRSRPRPSTWPGARPAASTVRWAPSRAASNPSVATGSCRTSPAARCFSARQPVRMRSRATSWRSTSRWAGRSAATWVSRSPTSRTAVSGPSSRIATFSAADKPVIFWTPDHGAFVVRGAMKAAWDKLRGPTGKLGAPVGDQATDGDVGLAEVHRRQDLVEPRQQHVHHRPGESGAVVVRSAGGGAEPAERFGDCPATPRGSPGSGGGWWPPSRRCCWPCWWALLVLGWWRRRRRPPCCPGRGRGRLRGGRGLPG